MCGVAGFIDFAGTLADPEGALRSMAARLARRGPDDEGVAFDPATRVGLAFRRLAILDRTEGGRQPMRSASGRFEIVFNGEVYEHEALRRRLVGAGRAPRFRGRSDTETILAAFEAFGIEAALPTLRGMFAFALLDRTERALWLVRDRFGVKPLAYALTGGHRVPEGTFEVPGGAALAFASDLTALRPLPGFDRSIDRESLRLYLRHGYVPAPRSIHPEARKLRPGSLLRVDLATGRVEERRWWSAREEFRRGDRMRLGGGDGGRGGGRPAVDPMNAIEAVDRAVLDSVGIRMVADVPVGALLSGGIDSSLVVAAMQSLSPRPVRTFTIGFGSRAFDEAPHARAIARHLGTEHVEHRVTDAEALATVSRLAEVWDEPFADSSQLPTLLVSELARREVTVALSGDGGDELFGGYVRHAWTCAIAECIGRIPEPARRLAAAILARTPRMATTRAFEVLGPLLPRRLRVARAGDRARRLADLLDAGDAAAIHARLTSINPDADALLAGGTSDVPRSRLDLDPGLGLGLDHDLEPERALMLDDVERYLPDDLLVKVDRASMAVGLEVREPLLDHRLAELAFSLPTSLMIRDGTGKWILREVLARRVPRTLFDRPKMGFAVPLRDWLRGPLRHWAEGLVDPDRIARRGLLDPPAVTRLWQRTLDRSQPGDGGGLWAVLMLEAWLDTT